MVPDGHLCSCVLWTKYSKQNQQHFSFLMKRPRKSKIQALPSPIVNKVLMTPLVCELASFFSAQPLRKSEVGDAAVCDKTGAVLLRLRSTSKTCLNTDKDTSEQDDGHGSPWLWQHRVFPRCKWAGEALWSSPMAPRATQDLYGHSFLSELSLLPVLFLHLAMDPAVPSSYLCFACWASQSIKPQLCLHLHLHLWQTLCHQHVLWARPSQHKYAMVWACWEKNEALKPKEALYVGLLGATR